VTELGFRTISFTDVSKDVMPSSRRMYLAGLLVYPVSKLLEWVKVRTKLQTGNIVAAIFQHKTLKQGLWKYGIFVARKAVEEK